MTPCFATLKRRMLTVTLALFLAQQWLGSAEAVAAGIVPAPNAPAANHPLTDTARNGVPTAARTLAYRSHAVLPMDPYAVPDNAVLLPDTTIYIDGLKRAGLPAAIQALLANHKIHHSPICVRELAFGFGDLDPARNGARVSWTGRPRNSSWTSVRPGGQRPGRYRLSAPSAAQHLAPSCRSAGVPATSAQERKFPR